MSGLLKGRLTRLEAGRDPLHGLSEGELRAKLRDLCNSHPGLMAEVAEQLGYSAAQFALEFDLGDLA